MAEPTKNDLREVAVRGLITNVLGPKWAPLADAGMTLIGDDSGEVYQKGKDFLGNLMSGYWERMGEVPARHAYENLTDRQTALTEKPFYTAKGALKERLRPEHDFFNPSRPTQDPNTGKWSAPRTKEKKVLEGAGWKRAFYENPEMTAEAVGATTAAAPLIAGGLFLNAFAQGSKPRSDYAYPVEPYRGGYDDSSGVPASSNEYNPSVESARAAARAREDLENLKQQHKKELIEMRGESRTPGVQGGGSFDVMGSLNNIYGSRQTNYFR